MAVCAGGAAASLAAFESIADVTLVVALLAVLAALASEAVIPLTSGGTPVAGVPKLIFATLRTDRAEILILPAAPMPASPASTVPAGATRLTSPAGSVGLVWIVRIPLPATAAPKVVCTLPLASVV